MTPEESQKIASAGSVNFENIIGLIVSCGLGVYLLAFGISMHILLWVSDVDECL